MKHLLKGFTLIEIMIVVAIIAILAAVAIPNFVKYRNESQRSSCISNMKQLQTAGEQYVMVKGATNVPKISDLIGKDSYIKKTPKCPYDNSDYGISLDGANNAILVTCKNSAAPYNHVLPN